MDMHTDKDKKRKPRKRDEVGEASRESFPASDPPAYWAAPPVRVKRRQTEPGKEESNESEPGK